MKFLSYLLTPIFYLFFGIILCVFHPIQWVAFNTFGIAGHKKVVDSMNWFLIKSLLFLGVNVHFKKNAPIPKNRSIIFASNHQSMFDIPPLIWYLRGHHPKFVSKIELGTGIPSISYNLRYGGSVLINRKDKKQAMTALENFAKKIAKNKWSAVIFPEGTRSRDGNPKPFSTGGLKAIIMHNPEAYIVPVSVNNSWKIFRYKGGFPLGVFSPLMVETHTPISLKDNNVEVVLKEVENTIKSKIIQS